MAVQGFKQSRNGTRSSFKREEDMEREENHRRNRHKGSLFVKALESGIIISQTFWYFIPLCVEVLSRFCGNLTEQ